MRSKSSIQMLVLSPTLRAVLHAFVVASIMAGLIPPPLVRGVLPPPAAELAEALLPEIQSAQAAAFGPYANNTNSPISNNACATPLTVTVNVPTNFMVNDLNVGFNASHTSRGELRVTLTSPIGTAVQIIANTADSDDNYDVLLDSSSANPLDNNANDLIGTPYYDRTVSPSNLLTAFNGQSTQGNWTLTICDNGTANIAGGTFNRAELIFDGDALPVATGSSVLTITKSVVGGGTGPFSVTVAGPSNYLATTTINDGQSRVINGLATGIYTVTESPPGAGWTTTYTATTGYSTGSSAVVTLTNPITATTFTSTQITGTVYADYNENGLYDRTTIFAETGVMSVTATAYNVAGAAIGSTQTDINGRFTMTLSSPNNVGPFRVEFTNLPAGVEPSRIVNGTQNGSSVQFINSAAQTTNLYLGVNAPCDYCQSSPNLATTTMVAGNQITNVNATTESSDTVVAFGYNSTTSTGAPTGLAQAQQVGTVYGVAYQRTSKSIFTAAFMKRHAGFGPGGPGAIYRIAPGTDGIAGTNDDVPSTFVVLDSPAYFGAGSFGVDPHPTSTEGIANSPYNWFHDANSLDKVAKMSFGDLDISEDEQELYTVNLLNRSLYRIPIGNPPTVPAPGAITVISVPVGLPGASQGCANSDVRPFGLGMYRQLVYVGMVCSAQSTNLATNLRAYVYAYDPATNTFAVKPVLEFPLNYTRSGNFAQTWKPYSDSFATIVASTASDGVATFTNYPSPILSDIVFDRGQMVLGFRDRASDQIGKYAGDASTSTATPTAFYYLAATGDILRACSGNDKSWNIENDGTCGSVTTTGSSSNNAGPGGGEYYYQDFAPYPGGASHVESGEGSMAQVPGMSEVVMSAIDATGLNSGGIQWLNNNTGVIGDAYEVYQSTNPSGAPSSPSSSQTPDTTFGKAGGMGDLEALCDPAPIEIGNRVWWDIDGDGVQDPGEPPLSGVSVSLQTISGTITTTTNISGTYIFTREAATGAYTQTLRSNTAYTITINTTPAGYSLTTADADGITSNHAISDVRDSDAALVSNIPMIYYTTGSAGQNNHGLDFGFTKPATGQVDILNIAPLPAQFGDRVWIEAVGNGVIGSGETITPVAGMEIYATNGTNYYTATTNSQGYYSFTIPSSSYTVTYGTVPASYGNVVPSTVVSGTSASGNAGSYQQAGNPDANHGQNTVVTVAAGEANWLIDFAFHPLPPSVQRFGNRLWLESDNDGDATSNFVGPVANHSITATNPMGTVYTTMTDADGYYTFTVPAGVYTVTYGLAPAGYQPSNMPGGDAVNAASGGNNTSHNNHTVVTLNTGEVITTVDFGFNPILASLQIVKVMTGGASSALFTVTVTGPNGYNVITTVTSSAARTIAGLPTGVYTVTETGLPAAPSGKTWGVATYAPNSNGSITLSSNLTGVVTVTNPLVDVISGSASLTITKNVIGSNQSNFQVTLTGPSYPAGQLFNIISGTNVITGLATGVYTVTETSPGAGWGITYTVNGVSSNVQAVATLGGAQTPITPTAEFYVVAIHRPREYTNTVTKEYAAVAMLPLTVTGQPGDAGYTVPITIATHNQVGAVFGLANDYRSNKIYAAAFMRRGADFGPNGPGAIYVLDRSTATWSLFADINSLYAGNPAGVDPHAFNDADVFNPVAYDAASPPFATKISWGGIELSADNATLYAVNLAQKALYEFPTAVTPAVGNIVTHTIPAPVGCVASDFVPFGLGLNPNDNKLYIGAVCGNESNSSADGLRAYLLRYDGSGVFVTSYQFPLTMARITPTSASEAWAKHTSAAYSTPTGGEPLFSDLLFDGNDLVMAFRDRKTDMVYDPANVSPGDVYRACWNGTTWVLEADGVCGGVTGSQVGVAPNRKFYSLFDAFNSHGGAGAVAQIPGQPLITTFNDPYTAQNGGARFLTSAGGISRNYEVFRESFPPIGSETLGKASGLGDLEVLYAPVTETMGSGGMAAVINITNTAPSAAALQIIKQVTGGASSDSFTVTVTGPSGYNVITTVTTSAARLLTTLTPGAYTVQETTLPDAPIGFTWSGTIYTPTGGLVTLSGGVTGIVTITNQLTPIPPSPATLRIIKEVTGGVSNDAFTVTVTGPNSFNQVTTVTPGTPTVLNNLTAGTYTVVESALPTAPNGFVWSGAIYTPTGGVINLAANTTDTVTITNQLAPQSLNLGNLVWIDRVRDGIFNPADSETGVAGVTVTLYLSGTASPIMTTTTDAGGHYTFTNLNPGDYVVKLPAANFANSAPLAGYLNTTTPVSAADINGNIDSDNDAVASGVLMAGGVTSLAIRLDFNQEPDDEEDDPPGGDHNTNYTVDFGFAQTLADLHLTKTGSTTSVTAGDLLTYTLTLTNGGPDTATNVIVRDLLPADVTYLTHTQSAGVYANLSGDWSLASLPVGSATLTMTVQVK